MCCKHSIIKLVNDVSLFCKRSKAILSRIPANRWGIPEDLAGAYVYLSSPASDYVHGSIITVDGGWMGR